VGLGKLSGLPRNMYICVYAKIQSGPSFYNRDLIFKICFMAFLCVFQQGEHKNTIKNFLGKIDVKNFWPKKLRKIVSGRLFPSFF
jgi:hypothetical protein